MRQANPHRDRPRELTGRTVLIIALACFGTIIAANMAMLFAATGSFPGLIVKNAYVASQNWNARTEAQQALGWRASVEYRAGALVVGVTDQTGAPVAGADLSARIGRPSSDAEDRELRLVAQDGAYGAPVALAPGLWRIDLTSADPAYAVTAELFVAEDR